MSDEVKVLNIPNMTIGNVISKLEGLYRAAIENGISFKNIPTPFFWGPAGVGKSEGVYEMANDIAGKTGKKVYVTDVRLLLFSPVDLRGIPVADEEKHFANWLMPKIFDMNSSSDCVNILFLDELSAAPQSVQATAYQICLDRKVGEFNLPENCIVIAAGNRTTDQSVSYKMPKALCNRLMHFNIKTDYEDWRVWALQNNISDKVIAYLAFDNSRLCMEPESSALAYATPRSWAFVSTLLKSTGGSPNDIHELIAACVGVDTALEFESFCRCYADMPLLEDIVEGKYVKLPKTHDVTYATICSLASYVIGKTDEINVDELDNICAYVLRLSRDFTMSFMKDIMKFETVNLKLMRCASYQSWMSHNRKFV